MASKRSCGCCSRRVLVIAFAFSGVVLLAAGLVLSVGGVFQNVIKKKINQNVELKPGSLVYDEWKKASTPIYMKYFVFNVTNPVEVMKDGATPNVTQMGPYSYREIRSNDVINWTSDNRIVTFMPNRTYIFDPETSCAGCNDKNDSFVSVNIPLLTVALWVKNTNYVENHRLCFIGLLIESFVFKVELFQRKTVHEILWGYSDPFLEFIKNSSVICPAQQGMSSFVQLQYNNTYYGISAVRTGQVDIDKLGQFTMWRDEQKLSWWSDKYANMINGTDGTQFSPGVSKDVTLYAFSPEICRSVYFNYESTKTLKGIKVYRFTAPDQLYLSGDVYKPNKGFCVLPRCLPTGLLNLTLCQPQYPPIAVSPPHFYQGNKSLVEDVNGLNPTKSEHETFVDIEPITGTVMRAAKRVQINVALEPVNLLPQTNGKFKNVFLPVMYGAESALISDDKAAEFRHKVYGAITATHVVSYLLIALGGLCIVVALVLVIVFASTKSRRVFEMGIQVGDSDERKPLVDEENDGNKVYT